MSEDSNRRPLGSRNIAFFHLVAKWLNRRGISPNAISIASMVFAAVTFVALLQTHNAEGWHWNLAWLIAAFGIQMRLLCNLLDGIVAIECHQQSSLGGLFNEVPDRVADVMILLGLGYSVGASTILGFWVSLLALFIAYLRALGASLTGLQAFHGPMAKPHRMFAATLVCLVCGLLPNAWLSLLEQKIGNLANAALWIMLAGSVVTVQRRLGFIGKKLRNKTV